MSLRWRFALIFATGAILATVVVATAAVWSTTRSLESEIDEFLLSRVEQIERISLPSRGVTTLQAFGETARIGEGVSGRGRVPILPALDSIVQINHHDGSLALIIEGSPELPAHDASPIPDIISVEVDGTSYRVAAFEAEGGLIVQIGRDLTETQAVVRRLRGQIASVGALFALIAGLGGWFAARRFVSPVEDLSSAAETIARTRDLSTPIAVTGQDEVGRLVTVST